LVGFRTSKVMYFFFSKILTIFLFPLPVAILLGILYALWYGKGKRKFTLLFPWLFLWFFSSFPVAQGLILPLEESSPAIAISDVPKSDAIVVLGGMVNNLTRQTGRVELTSAADRLTDSILLLNGGKAKKIIFTGGSGILFFKGESEASQGGKFLRSFGVPESKIILEDQSRNTHENAVFTQSILQKEGYKSIILVTSAFHMKRALREFSNRGILVHPYPTDFRTLQAGTNAWDYYVPSVGALDTSTIAIKEWVGIIMYQAMDILNR
jgi:uncharacterized SAM-binding protein YcdF (DUF218 family)